MERLRVVDSHTGGEPTRCVIDGLPDLGSGSLSERLEVLKRDCDRYRTAVIGEPRSPSFAVGAYLLPSSVADHGVVFFNNEGYLGMCGHGTIGLIATLAYLGRLEPGAVKFETPVGIVRGLLHQDGRASFENVPSYRLAKAARLSAGGKSVEGDVAYGGNWFFITSAFASAVAEGDLANLLTLSRSLKVLVEVSKWVDSDYPMVDHIELTGPSKTADARSFVLCPGGEYDRSPCGTGTSAKLACLYEDGKLKEGEIYTVESAIGSVFEGSVRRVDGKVIPTITGRAFVNGETSVLIDPDDPFAWGVK